MQDLDIKVISEDLICDCYVSTPLGMAYLKGDSGGLTELRLTDIGELETVVPKMLEPAVAQLREYFGGSRRCFDLSLNPVGTPFQKRVWAALTEIPFGSTLSYIKLAQKLGDPLAVRAVAAANGKNPLWIVIPCHRVIGSDGSLTGYAGGLGRKRWLINHEGLEPQQVLF
jgi:methylated-DNA-[protein]-cysteine S-methyltransferase